MLVGLGKAGSETVEERPPAVMVTIVSCACTIAAARARKRVVSRAIVLDNYDIRA